MSLDHHKQPSKPERKRVQKKIPVSRPPVPDPARKTGDPSEEHDTDMQMPLFAGLNPVFQGSLASGTSKMHGAGSLNSFDEVRVQYFDSFMKKLSEEFYGFCRLDMQEPLPAERISMLYRQSYEKLSDEEKKEISPRFETPIINALSRVPGYLFAEKDPDHTGEDDVPDIGELLALDAYLQAYEPENPEGTASEIHSGYHRGNPGQPDFVYRDGMGKTLKGYDPLKLPREDSPKTWLDSAFDQHAGGKSSGAVCILNVSDATSQMLAYWNQRFWNDLKAIKEKLDASKDIESQHANLMRLCNTYVVSYGENAEGNPEETPLKALQEVFDDAREYLRGKPFLQQLEAWREESSKPMDFGDSLAELFEM